MFAASVMLRQACPLRNLLKNRSNAAFLWHNGSRTMSSAAPPHEHFDVEGEPNFLEMVEQYVENARGIALQKLVTKPPRPGRRPQPPDQKRAFVKGENNRAYAHSFSLL